MSKNLSIKQILLVGKLIVSTTLFAQDNYLQPGSLLYQLADRYEVIGGRFIPETQLTGGMVQRKQVIQLLEDFTNLSKVDAYNKAFFAKELAQGPYANTAVWHNRKGIAVWQHFYTSPAYLFDYADSGGNFRLTLNPVLGLELGQDRGVAPKRLYRNTRGAEVRGYIGQGQKTGFYSLVTENQQALPALFDYYTDSLGYLPQHTFWKPFKKEGYDYFHARGYVWKQFGKTSTLRLGHDKVFWGNGMRSLLLGDAAPPTLFLQHKTQLGAFEYQNYFIEMIDFERLTGANLLGRKYAALHRLGVNVHKKLNIGFYEAIVFGRSATNGGFDLQYLNPIIFYRSIEQNIGSSDNAMMGLDWKWNLPFRMQCYGQFVLDEFKLSEIRGRTGWWANKYASQAGIKAYNLFGISNVDMQLEYNAVRPFTYSHFASEGNWAHYGQAMAHPLGANFREGIAKITAQVLPKLRIQATAISFVRGEDSSLSAANYGGDILRNYSKRAKEFDNYIGQGKEVRGQMYQLNIGWMLAHNVVLEGTAFLRKTNSDNEVRNPLTRSIVIGLRWNLMAEHHLQLF